MALGGAGNAEAAGRNAAGKGAAPANPYAEPSSYGMPRKGMKLDPERVALVVIDPQIDFLSPKGIAWGAVGESVEQNNTVPNLLRLFKAAKGAGIPVVVSPHYYYPTDHQWEFGDQRALTRRDRPQGSTGRGGQHRTPQQDAQADGHELQQAAALAAHHHGAQTCRAPPRRSGAGCRKVSICAQGVHVADSGAWAGPAPWLADEWMERSAGCRVPAGGPQASGARHPMQGSVPGGADANHGKRAAAPFSPAGR